MPTYKNNTNDIIYFGEVKYLYPEEEISTIYDYSDTELTEISSNPIKKLVSEEVSILSADTFTDWVLVSKGVNVDLSIAGTFSATVNLQRKFAENGDVEDVDTFTLAEETYFYSPTKAYYRIGVDVGNYTSGTVNLRMKV